MEFSQADVKSINANIGTKLITLSFTVELTVDNLDAAKDLSRHVGKSGAGKVDLNVEPMQLPLIPDSVRGR